MKTYYTKIHSSFIIKLIRIYTSTLEEIIDEKLQLFENEETMKQYKSSYKEYCDCIEKLKSYRDILEHSDQIDFIIIND